MNLRCVRCLLNPDDSVDKWDLNFSNRLCISDFYEDVLYCVGNHKEDIFVLELRLMYRTRHPQCHIFMVLFDI